MINEENLNKLYEGLMNENELTTKELNSYGFHSKDISDLIEQGILERTKRGHYSFLAINDLYYYGKKLLGAKEYHKADICFKKCYELDPNHPGTCFQLFLRSIKEKDYDQAFQYFEVLSNTNNKYYMADSNFYLYLLSIITDIPEKYKEYARHLQLEDIRVDFSDKRYKDIPLQNKIRLAVLQRKFSFALKQLKDITVKYNSNTLQDIVAKTLLYQAINTEKIRKNEIINLIKSKQYHEVIAYLENEQKRHDLSLVDDYILILTKDLLTIMNNNKVHQKKVIKTESMFEAIDGYNYELALKLNQNYSTEKNITENAIRLLLIDICNLINNLNKPTEREVVIQKNNINPVTKFSDVINCLMHSDLENAFKSLKDYMNSINKSDYELLIINLIKLSLLEKDTAFTKPMLALTNISRDNFNFDISNYIQEFYIALSQNKFKEARIYLDIISIAEKLGQVYMLSENLLPVLNKAEETINKKISTDENDLITDNNTPISEEIHNPKVEPIIVSNTNQDEEYVPSDSEESKYYEPRENEIEFIEKKYQQLVKNQGIILLRPMNSERRRIIHDIVKEYNDMVSFSIGEGENKQVVLRYKLCTHEYVNIKELLRNGQNAYYKGEYDEALKNYLEVLRFGTPKVHVYGKIGLIYMKKWNKEKAIEYLTIATYLGKQEENNKKYDYTELINVLNGTITEEDRKPRFDMKEKEFVNDMDNYFEIDNFEAIHTYIIESGLDVESACIELGLDEEQITQIKLIYAKEYYSQGEYEKGDEFLNDVEKSQNKSKLIKKQLVEIRKNKKFYFNREKDNPKQLSLTLKPRAKKKTFKV